MKRLQKPANIRTGVSDEGRGNGTSSLSLSCHFLHSDRLFADSLASFYQQLILLLLALCHLVATEEACFYRYAETGNRTFQTHRCVHPSLAPCSCTSVYFTLRIRSSLFLFLFLFFLSFFFLPLFCVAYFSKPQSQCPGRRGAGGGGQSRTPGFGLQITVEIIKKKTKKNYN